MSATTPDRPMQALWQRHRAYRRRFVLAVVMSTLNKVADVVPELLTGAAVDVVVRGDDAQHVPDDDGDIDMEKFRRTLRVNAGSPARMAQAFLTRAQSAGGKRVIHLTDQKIANPNPDFFSYTMSKHALASTVPMLAMGAARPDDRVYALAPGAILASHDQREEETEISHRMNLLKRKTGQDEVAQAALFLAQGHLASGQTIYCDSGQHLLSQPRDVIYLAREERHA